MALLSKYPDAPPLIRAVILGGCAQAAADLGLNARELFIASGLDPEQAASRTGFIEKPRLVHFLQTAAELSGCDYFGLVLAKYQPPLDFGPATQLLTLAPTLRIAMQNCVRYVELYGEGTIYELVAGAQESSFRRSSGFHYDINPRQLDYLGIAHSFKAIQALCGGNCEAISVCLTHPEPRDSKAFTEFFNCPVRFSQPFSGIVFSSDMLDKPLPNGDEELMKIVEGYYSRELPHHTDGHDIVRKVTEYIRITLGTPVCNIEDCAQKTYIQPRTLQRQLAKHGCTFKQLVLDTRMEMASSFLQNPSMSITQIAYTLGYGNSTAFTRAFRNHFGMAPLRWRSENPPRQALRGQGL